MWIVAIITIVAIISVWIEVPPMWKKREKKEVYFYTAFLLIAVGIGFAYGMQLMVGSPLQWLIFLFKPMSNMIMHLLY